MQTDQINKVENIDMTAIQEEQDWSLEISPKSHLLQLNLRDVWRYRDLLLLMVRRDFVAFYKQTILGPLWFFIQPLLTTLMYLLIFGRIAKLSTDGVPGIVFYLSGVTCWAYFSDSLTKTSDTFIANASIFGKVYFPRLVIPLSIVLSNLIRFGIQLSLFLIVWVWYLFFSDAHLQPNAALLLLPLLIVLLVLLSLGLGIIFSSLTTKYRDLRFLLSFGIQLAMFATPVVYPLSMAPAKYKWLLVINPMTGIIETFRYAFLGSGQLHWGYLGYSAAATTLILLLGIVIFNRVEKSFMDIV
jgi:lipopolysaccharide transport system permease protein